MSIEKYVGKVAVVTGASAGIGKSIAETLVKAGVIVAALARRSERLEEHAKALSGEKGKLHPFKCDIKDENEILSVFKEIEKLGPIHILVNNAGVSHDTSLIGGDTKKWKSILDTNVLAVAIFSREAIRNMKENNTKGHLININSIAGHTFIDFPLLSLYPASKFALTAFTENLRLEINREKLPIKITSISPGYVNTEFPQANFTPESLTPEAIEKFGSWPALEAEDITNAVIYVLSTPDRVNVKDVLIHPLGGLY